MKVDITQIYHSFYILVSARAHSQHQRCLPSPIEVMHRVLETGSHALVLQIKLMEKSIEHSLMNLVILLTKLVSLAQGLKSDIVVKFVTQAQV